MSFKILQIHKRSSYEFKFIQDKFSISSNFNAIALSDGTTQSFNSEFWASILTDAYVNKPLNDPNKLTLLFKNCVEKYKDLEFQFSSNPAKASLEKAKKLKGGTATFLGLNFIEREKIDLISCGDSNFFLLKPNGKIIYYPFSDVDSLDSNSFFINTEALLNDKINSEYFINTSLDVRNNDKIILATDALSRLLLTKIDVLQELISIDSFNEFKDFCLKYWENKELQEDDISAIVISIDNSNEVKSLLPPFGFSFPKEKDEEFTPSILYNEETELKLDNMQINEINQKFNDLNRMILKVNRKQKTLLLLMLSFAFIVLLITSYFIYQYNNDSQNLLFLETKYEKKLNKKNDIITNMQDEIDQLKINLTMKNNTNQMRDTVSKIKSDSIKIPLKKKRK